MHKEDIAWIKSDKGPNFNCFGHNALNLFALTHGGTFKVYKF